MKVVKGSKEVELSQKDFSTLVASYDEVILDLGTGDGRFVYATARENPKSLVIGVDPSKKQMSIYSKKVNKEKIKNALFGVGSVEQLPKELVGVADRVYINFPWGSLLAGIANTDAKVVEAISSLLKDVGGLEIVFGYSQDAEPSEVNRLGLDNLSLDKIKDEIIPEFEKHGLKLVQSLSLKKNDIFEIDSTWGKKLSFGQNRQIFRLMFKKG